MEQSAIKNLILPYLESNRLDLAELEWIQESGMQILRIAISDEYGMMDLETCEKVSNDLSPILDDSPLQDISYYLEVCSAGAERELKDEAAIQKAIGRYVHVKLTALIEGQQEWSGTLLGSDDESLQLEIQIKSRKKKVTILKRQLAKIRLAVKI